VQIFARAGTQIGGAADEVQRGGAGHLLVKHHGFMHWAQLPKAEACFVAERYGAPLRPDKGAKDGPFHY
jgi:hypothetical protein